MSQSRHVAHALWSPGMLAQDPPAPCRACLPAYIMSQSRHVAHALWSPGMLAQDPPAPCRACLPAYMCMQSCNCRQGMRVSAHCTSWPPTGCPPAHQLLSQHLPPKHPLHAVHGLPQPSAWCTSLHTKAHLLLHASRVGAQHVQLCGVQREQLVHDRSWQLPTGLRDALHTHVTTSGLHPLLQACAACP